MHFLHTHTHVINRNNPPGVAPWTPPLSVPQLWGTSQFCTSEAVDETFGAIIGLSCPSTLSLTNFVPLTRFHFIRLFWNHTFTYIKTKDMYSYFCFITFAFTLSFIAILFEHFLIIGKLLGRLLMFLMTFIITSFKEAGWSTN